MRKRKHDFARGLLITLVVFAALFFCGTALFREVGEVSHREELTLVHDAVRRAAVSCYAVEGAYPSTIRYLEENYGLVYDDDTYFVLYDAFASNIMPQIRVVERGTTL